MCALVSSLQRNDERGGHLISSHRLLGRHECGGVMNDARLRVAPFRVTRVVLHAVWTNRAACHVCVVRHLWVTGRRAHGRYKMRRVKVRMDPIPVSILIRRLVALLPLGARAFSSKPFRDRRLITSCKRYFYTV